MNILEKYKEDIENNKDQMEQKGFRVLEVSEELIPNIRLIHECGKEKIVKMYNFRQGKYGCDNRECKHKTRSSVLRYSDDKLLEVYKNYKSRHKESYEVEGIRRDKDRIKVTLKHKVCGEIFECDGGNYINDSFNCINRECRRKKRSDSKKLSDEVLLSNIGELSEYQKEFEIVEIVRNPRLKLKLKHSICGEITEIWYDAFKKDSFCCHSNRCKNQKESTYSSKEERNILSICRKVFKDSKKVLRGELLPYELDVYIPSLKIAFEYNGLYWHSVHSRGVKSRSYHIEKTKIALSKDIKIYYLWSHWNENIIKSFINNKLGISERLYARKCIIRMPSKEEEKEFFNNNHFQGFAPSSISWGLRYNNEWVSMISLRFTNGFPEVARFVNKCGYTVVGGFTKLFNEFKEYCKVKDYKYIISFCDRDLCPDYHDSVYYKYGFRLEKDSGPISWYYNLNTKEVIERQKLQKHKLRVLFPDSYSDNKSADQILAENNIVPCYNSGDWKFILDI